MKEWNSAEEIGQHGYTHWSGKPITPGRHESLYVPQTVADGWHVYCSCGEWKAAENFYEIPRKDALLNALSERHKAHAERA